MVVSHVPPTGDLAHNPAMYPDWELNRQPFDSQPSTQSAESHQPGLLPYFRDGETETSGDQASVPLLHSKNIKNNTNNNVTNIQVLLRIDSC